MKVKSFRRRPGLRRDDIPLPAPHQPHVADQRVARGRQRLEFIGAAAGVGVGGLGGALPGLVDFRRRQRAVDRQAEHLPVAFLGRELSGLALALAEAWIDQRQQFLAQDAEPAPRREPRRLVRIVIGRAAQDRQRLHGGLPQQPVIRGRGCDMRGDAHGFAIVGLARRPEPLEFEFPFREMSIHGATSGPHEYDTGLKLSVAAPFKFELACSERPKPGGNPMPLLENHIAVVTGSGSGIGRAIALGYAREGAQVTLLDIDGKAAETAAQEIRDAGGLAESFAQSLTAGWLCHDTQQAATTKRTQGSRLALLALPLEQLASTTRRIQWIFDGYAHRYSFTNRTASQSLKIYIDRSFTIWMNKSGWHCCVNLAILDRTSWTC